MMTVLFRVLALTVVLVAVCGCGGDDAGGSAIAEPQTEAEAFNLQSVADLRNTLQVIADSGEGGSMLGGITEMVAALELPAEQKDELLELDARLQATGSDEQRKEIAGEMIARLPAPTAGS